MRRKERPAPCIHPVVPSASLTLRHTPNSASTKSGKPACLYCHKTGYSLPGPTRRLASLNFRETNLGTGKPLPRTVIFASCALALSGVNIAVLQPSMANKPNRINKMPALSYFFFIGFAVLVAFRCILVHIKQRCRGDNQAIAEHNIFYQRMPAADLH